MCVYSLNTLRYEVHCSLCQNHIVYSLLGTQPWERYPEAVCIKNYLASELSGY